MKFIGVFVFSFVLSNSIKAQNIFPEKFSGCNTNHFVLEDRILSINNKDSLLKAIRDNVEPKALKKAKGKLMIQVVIDTLGNACCLSLENSLNIPHERLNIEQVINNTKWGIPINKSRKVKVAAILELLFSDDEIYLTRRGLNGYSGWSNLESTYISKK